MDYLKEAITAHYGERCKDDEPGCPCCDAWRQYDGLMAETAMAFEVAANTAQEVLTTPSRRWDGEVLQIPKRILATTPTHASAALAARDKAKREAALEEAAKLTEYLEPDEGQGTDHDRGYEQACADKAAAIRALKGEVT